MKCRLGRVCLIIHPFLPAFLLFCGVRGCLFSLLPALLALVWHECGHLLIMRVLGRCPEEITLSPVGGLMTCDVSSLPRGRQALIYLGGPLFSLLGYVLCYAALLRPSAAVPFLLDSLRAHLLLTLFNLLPVLPLDGGQALGTLMRRRPAVQRVLTGGGFLCGVALIVFSMYSALKKGAFQPAPALTGCFLIYLNTVSVQQSGSRCIHEALCQRMQLEKGRALPARMYALLDDTPLCRALPCLSSGRYVFILPVDRSGRPTHPPITHADVCASLMVDAGITLGSAAEKATKNLVAH